MHSQQASGALGDQVYEYDPYDEIVNCKIQLIEEQNDELGRDLCDLVTCGTMNEIYS